MERYSTEGKWEKRWHPLRREWVVYAAHRNSRPWDFKKTSNTSNLSSYDPSCYLCPGNPRISEHINPEYNDIYIFDNDHPVVGRDAPEIDPVLESGGLYKRSKAEGIARVVSYHPRHDLNMSSIPTEGISKIFLALREQMIEFDSNPKIKFVLIFENRGEMVGVSNPHPHCQIYATDFVFNIVKEELKSAELYRQEKDKNIFEEIIRAEQKDSIRIVAENEGAIAFIPFFARYAYEIMIFPKNRHANMISMSEDEIGQLASVFQEVTRRFDMNYKMMFPYVMSVLQAPVDGNSYNDYHLHLLIQPPLRQPGLKKFLAGPEIGGGNFMADTMPEEKAEELKNIDVSEYNPKLYY